jgi:choice-of-anchor B domain-containing protein
MYPAATWPVATDAADENPPTLQLLSQLDPATDTKRNSDITGYADPLTGREYAIMGGLYDDQVYVIDVTDPHNPFEAALIIGANGFDLKIWDHYLYCVDGDGSQADDGTVWDISDPTSPYQVGTMASAHNITFADGYLYLSAGYWGLTILDAADPSSNAYLWKDDTHTGHDATIVGNRLYDFHGGEGTFIYDITNKSAPVLLGGIPNPVNLSTDLTAGVTYHHNGAPSVDGNYLYLTDELGDRTAPDITVWSIADPSATSLVKKITDPKATVHNVYVVDDLLYASFYVAGVRVYDIADPSNPVLLDEYDTAPAYARNGEFNGCWGVYPNAPSGVIYASDIENGLFLFSFGVAVPVTITAFTAQYSEGAVDITWAISYAEGLEGFRIYRSREPDDGYRRIASVAADAPRMYSDSGVEFGRTYYYRLGAMDRDGEFVSQTRRVTVPAPEFALQQNYPNPFNPTTNIDFVLPEAGDVSLAIYDAAGHRVRTLLRETRAAGPHSLTWDGTDDAGLRVASGVYFYRLEAAGVSETQRMTLLK